MYALLCLVLFAAACASDEPAEEEASSAFDELFDNVDESGFEGVVATDAEGERRIRAFGNEVARRRRARRAAWGARLPSC